jgi:hypothetical protein
VIWPGRRITPTFLCGERENCDLRSSESDGPPDLRRVPDPRFFPRGLLCEEPNVPWLKRRICNRMVDRRSCHRQQGWAVYGTVVLSGGGMIAFLLKLGAEKRAYNGYGQGAAWR